MKGGTMKSKFWKELIYFISEFLLLVAFITSVILIYKWILPLLFIIVALVTASLIYFSVRGRMMIKVDFQDNPFKLITG